MAFFSEKQTENIVSIAIKAGEIATSFFQEKTFLVSKKSDNSQVTSADIAVSKFLRDELSKEFGDIPIICEEGDLRDISGEIFFLIDPIDGTSSFVSGSCEFSINIALVKNNEAIFGLIYAPVFEGGKMIFSDHQNQVVIRNLNGEQRPIKSNNFAKNAGLKIITSARTKDVDIIKYVNQIHSKDQQNFVVERLSSAIKFFRLLEGEANLYLHFRPSMEWDTAAGQALVELNNGKVKKLFFNQDEISIGESLEYKKLNFTNGAFVAKFDNLW